MTTMTNPLIEINEIIARLLDLPAGLAAAEATLLKGEQGRRRAADRLADASDRLLLDGNIDGRNAEVRSAQLRQALYGEQAELDQAEDLVTGARIQLHRLQAEHSSLRAVARLIAGNND